MFKPINFLNEISKVRYFIDENGNVKDYLGNYKKPYMRSINSKHQIVDLLDTASRKRKIGVDFLVYNAFIGNHDKHICHLDNNPRNNHLDNLKSYYTILKENGFIPVNNYRSVVPNKYYVNKEGQIFSLFSETGIKFKEDNDGYYTMTMATTNPLQKQITVRIATIVLTMFKGEPPKDMVYPTVDHIDHNIHNNNIDNLRWLEMSENYSNKLTNTRGMNSYSAKLNDDIVEKIKKYPAEIPSRKIIEELKLNISASNVQKIRNGSLWGHIRPDLNIDHETFKLLNRSLTDDQVREIRKLHEKGFGARSIKKIMNLNRSKDCIQRVYNYEYYKDVN